MKKYIFLSLCFGVFSATSNAQKKGKIASPEADTKLNTSAWQNTKTNKYSLLEYIDKRQLDSVLEKSIVLTATSKNLRSKIKGSKI